MLLRAFIVRQYDDNLLLNVEARKSSATVSGLKKTGPTNEPPLRILVAAFTGVHGARSSRRSRRSRARSVRRQPAACRVARMPQRRTQLSPRAVREAHASSAKSFVGLAQQAFRPSCRVVRRCFSKTYNSTWAERSRRALLNKLASTLCMQHAGNRRSHAAPAATVRATRTLRHARALAHAYAD